jgi:hypothetical protein
VPPVEVLPEEGMGVTNEEQPHDWCIFIEWILLF